MAKNQNQMWRHVLTGEVIRLYGGVFNGAAIKVVIPANSIIEIDGYRYFISKNDNLGGYDGQCLT